MPAPVKRDALLTALADVRSLRQLGGGSKVCVYVCSLRAEVFVILNKG